ncbi:Ig-like domain-containing protein [Ignavibacterium sp.]|uniref:Ig-like domain-containing protein n=1 Tax=Ignavibacterium sp. TaxID=2651167 RepID=UPI00307ED3A3
MVKSAKIIFVIASMLFLFISCANQLPPGGGDGDTTPPEIIYSFPEDGTTNFKENYFEVEFSEYVDKRSFREAIFISPAIEGEIEIDWTGRTANVSFPKGLKPNLTYVVNIGTDVVDLNNRNRMASTFTLTFSTGNEIDRRKISGKVFNKDADGTLIFAYMMKDDTTDYLLSKPDYLSQVGKDGTFVLNGLASSQYRIFAVKDQFKDLIFQSDQDMIGIPYQDVFLSKDDSVFSDLNFFLFKADTVKPRLLEALMTDERHLIAKFSEEIDSTAVNIDNFRIVDSTSNLISNILYAYKGSGKKEEIVLVPEEKLNPSEQLYLLADKMIDLSKNETDSDKVSILISDRPDTISLKIIKTEPVQYSKVDFMNAVIFIYFDDAFVKGKIINAIQFTDSIGNRVPFDISFPDDATLLIKPLINLKADYGYMIKLDLNYFEDANGNKTDSVYQMKFSTISGLEFTGVSGKVSSADSNLVLVLESNSKPEKKFFIKSDTNLNFSFERIEAGAYTLWAFVDKNNDRKFDYGWFNPFRFSEKFYIYPEVLNLRPRWSLTDLLFKIEK